MTSINLVNVSNYILNNVSMYVGSGEVYVLMGPNGAGKTTTLKVIAGLVKYRGSVLFDGRPVDGLPPWKRGVGYLPQTIALFPHMTVEENIMYGLRSRGYSVVEARSIAKYYMELLGIEDLRDKYPLKLSVGERKKVALARALAIDPKVLLLDEPFTGIQYDHVVHIANVVRYVADRLGKTVIIVSHDIDESITLGSRFGVMSGGKLVFEGDRTSLLTSISRIMRFMNSMECIVDEEYGDVIVKLSCRDVNVYVSKDCILNYNQPYADDLRGKRLLAIFPADKIVVGSEPFRPSINVFKARVLSIEIYGGVKYAVLGTGDTRINAALPMHLRITPGQEIYVKIPLKHIRAIVT